MIVIVGPCGAGKTTLVRSLQTEGFHARAVAQEHSVIRDLWRHAGEPAVLIFLDATPAVISARRRHDFPAWLYDEQQVRLKTARAHASFVVNTDTLSAVEVCQRVIAFLQTQSIQRVDRSATPERPAKG